MGRRAGDEEGFTLIELLVVIIIIGTLASIAIPIFLNQRQKGWDAQVKSDLRNVASEQVNHLAETGDYATTVVDQPQPAVPAANTIYYNRSPNAGIVTSENVSAAGTLVGVTTDSGFCLLAVSDSGRTFSYLSTVGIVKVGNSCP